MVAAPEVAPSRSLPTFTLRAKVDPSPKFSANLYYHERCCNWPAGSRHQTVARGKMAQCSSVVVCHSLIRVDHQHERNFLETVRRPRDILWTHSFHRLASAWTCLRSMYPPVKSTGHYPSAQANFTQDRPSVCELGKKGSIYATATTRAGRPTGNALSAQYDSTDSF